MLPIRISLLVSGVASVAAVAVRLGLAVHHSLTCTCSAVQLQLMPAVLLCGDKAQVLAQSLCYSLWSIVFLIFPPASTRPPGMSDQ